MENNKRLSLYCVKYGETTLPESMAFLGGSKDKSISITLSFYLVKTEGKNILIDAGCDTMPGFDLYDFKSPDTALSDTGVLPDEITDVIITHAHHDHIDGIKHFKNATVHISEESFRIGKKYIPENITVDVFNNELQINSQIRVIEFCGHSYGSAFVEIITDDLIHIVAGDECYTNANIENKICSGCVINKKKGIEFVNKFSNKKYRVHTSHDKSLKTERII